LRGTLPVPLPRVPWKTFFEAIFKNPEEGWFGERRELFGYSKGGSMFFLCKDPDWVATLRGEGHLLRAHRSNKVVV